MELIDIKIEKYNYHGKEKEMLSLDCSNAVTVDAPLWYHKRGLMQTATGYGRKLVTDRKIKIGNRLYRIYCCQISNSGSIYIIVKGQWVFLRYLN